MTDVQLLAKVRNACRITQATEALNDELTTLINAAFLDMSLSDINDIAGLPYTAQTANAGIINAVITYVRANFGDLLDVAEQQQLLLRYDEQKKMLKMLRYSTQQEQDGDDDA